jgi:hypothetical protein
LIETQETQLSQRWQLLFPGQHITSSDNHLHQYCRENELQRFLKCAYVEISEIISKTSLHHHIAHRISDVMRKQCKKSVKTSDYVHIPTVNP